MIRIFIADDHSIVREGLKQILAETTDMVVSGEAGTGPEALQKVRQHDYDILLIDISLPGMNGLDLLKQLKDEGAPPPILILSVHPEEQYAIRALRAGAAGYLTKESLPDELVAAIRKVSAGRRYVSPSLAERLAVEIEHGATGAPHEALSDREYQVLCMIASGKTVGKIARDLSLSVKTVHTYRSRILVKMNLESNAALTHYAIKNRLVD
jgi:DNA-binding NarL/FixJ family response regulator